MVTANLDAFLETIDDGEETIHLLRAVGHEAKDLFCLDSLFISRFVGEQPNWGPLGYVTYKRTYARPLNSVQRRHQSLAERAKLKDNEEFWLTLVRVVEGVYRFQQAHCHRLRLPWNPVKAQDSAQEMFLLMWQFRFLPPGRGLWMMGTDYLLKVGGSAANNCAFTSTAQIDTNFSSPFCFLMDMSMLGVGVGWDPDGAGKVEIQKPERGSDVHVVADSREGWVDSLRRVLDSYVGKEILPTTFDYSEVRSAGSPIKGFGGTSSGPSPLMELIAAVQSILDLRVGQKITVSDIADIFTLIGRCVVAGNIRRSAELGLGEDSIEFMDLKDPVTNLASLQSHRWAANMSIKARVGQDYTRAAEKTGRNGEPGYVWLDNARHYSRMGDQPDHRDKLVAGVNPCSEMSLESFELCNLCETFPSKHDSYEQYQRTLKFAYLYAKTVTLIPTHDSRTNAVMLRNRRIGMSMSGIVQAFQKHGRREFLNWCDKGYGYLRELDAVYSDWLCIPRSKKITTVKPSGTVSLLPGVTPGIHYPHSEYYNRVIRFATNSPMLPALRAAGFRCVEIDPAKEPNTVAVYFPVKEENFDRAKEDVSMWEQLENAAALQHYWTDNQVSATVTFKKTEAKDIRYALELYESRLKGVSFLPLTDHGYSHAPYQTITKAEYEMAVARLSPLDLACAQHEQTEKFCDGDSCQAPLKR